MTQSKSRESESHDLFTWLTSNRMDRTELLMNLANILQLTPASICMYAARRSSHTRKLIKVPPEEARSMHLRAAASVTREDDWLLATANGRRVKWRNFARDQRLRIPDGHLKFPSRKQCPWQMMTYASVGKNNNVGLKLAVDSHNVPDRKGRLEEFRPRESDEMSDEEFMNLNAKRSLALGVYKTTCAPYPLRIFYSLVEGLTELGKDSSAFMALGALDDLDLDI
jgi:hypothetical protein